MLIFFISGFYLPQRKMKRLVLIGLLLNSCLSSYAQNTEVDSLQLLVNGTNDQTEQVRLLSQLSIVIRFHSSDTIIIYAKSALAIARASGNPQLLSKGLLSAGKAYHTKQQLEEARLYCDSALLIAKISPDSLQMANSIYEMGRRWQNRF